LKKIEITTSQNVPVQYTLASAWERAVALFLDVCILFMAGLLLSIGIRIVSRSSTDLLIYLFVVPLVLFYSLAFEMFNNGRTPGKAALSLRVVRMDGRATGLLDHLMRWVFRGFEIYLSLGTIAFLSVISSRYNQRIGDFFANTVVVNLGKSDRVQLTQLLNLEKHINRVITYPQSARLLESTAVLIKETLDREATIGNDAHENALRLLAVKIQKQLDIRGINDHRKFLETVLGDYVVLTR
jgi:uncharacterized RDD family membrane protein YckC